MRNLNWNFPVFEERKHLFWRRGTRLIVGTPFRTIKMWKSFVSSNKLFVRFEFNKTICPSAQCGNIEFCSPSCNEITLTFPKRANRIWHFQFIRSAGITLRQCLQQSVAP
jgi:hypothetical protein